MKCGRFSFLEGCFDRPNDGSNLPLAAASVAAVLLNTNSPPTLHFAFRSAHTPSTIHFAFRSHSASLFPFQCALLCLCVRARICATFPPCNMVDNLVRITSEYDARLAACPYVPRLSYGRRMLRDDGDPNRLFLAYLFCDESNAIQ